MEPLTLHFYTKTGCPLCEKASAALERVLAQLPDAPFDVQFRDIETNADWFAEYQWDIPVVELDGIRLVVHRVYEPRLIDALRRTWNARRAEA